MSTFTGMSPEPKCVLARARWRLARGLMGRFAARAARVDGAYHSRRVAADARRDRVLALAGYRVLRLDAELVLRELESAVARVAAAVRECLRQI